MLDYFKALSEVNELKSDNGEFLLVKKFANLNSVKKESILFHFLQGSAPELLQNVENISSNFIFPFGCNMSQKLAVQQAYCNPISTSDSYKCCMLL